MSWPNNDAYRSDGSTPSLCLSDLVVCVFVWRVCVSWCRWIRGRQGAARTPVMDSTQAPPMPSCR